jgi:hypothetical protein
MEKIYHVEVLNKDKNIVASSYKNKDKKYTVCLYLYNINRYISTVIPTRFGAMKELHRLRTIYGKQ